MGTAIPDIPHLAPLLFAGYSPPFAENAKPNSSKTLPLQKLMEYYDDASSGDKKRAQLTDPWFRNDCTFLLF
jgi:hypothetical protein